MVEHLRRMDTNRVVQIWRATTTIKRRRRGPPKTWVTKMVEWRREYGEQ